MVCLPCLDSRFDLEFGVDISSEMLCGYTSLELFPVYVCEELSSSCDPEMSTNFPDVLNIHICTHLDYVFVSWT